MSAIEFRPLGRADLPMLREWLERPHIAEWWDTPPSVEALEAEYGAAIDERDSTRAFIAYADGEPIGFIQLYTPVDAHADGWWLDEHDPHVRGIDQFLADAHNLGQGLGTRMIRTFVERLFEDPDVRRVQVDPAPSNARAIRCYEKVGFRRVAEVETPDGPAVLMYIDRPDG